MRGRFSGFRSLWVLLIALFWAAGARAQGQRKIVVVYDPAVRCVRYDALLAALRRDTSYEVRLSENRAPSAAEGNDRRVLVELSTERGAITVRLVGDDLNLSERLAATSCEATTEVVAAFVASALSPAPQVSMSEPKSEAPVRVEPRALPPPVPNDTIVAQRATLLADAMSSRTKGGTRVNRQILGGGIAVLGLSAVGFSAFNYVGETDHDTRMRLVGLGGAGALLAVTGVGLVARPDELPPSLMLSPSMLALGILAGTAGSPQQLPRWGFAGVVGGYVGQAVLFAASDLVQPPLTLKRTRAIYRSIRSPEQRAKMTADDLRALEDEIENARAPWSPFVAVLPLTLGGAVALASALDSRYDDDARRSVAWQGTLMLSMALGYGLYLDGAPDRVYSERLQASGFRVGITPLPGGSMLTAAGRF